MTKVIHDSRTATVVRTSRRGLVLIRFEDTGKTQWLAPQQIVAAPKVEAPTWLGMERYEAPAVEAPIKLPEAVALGRLGGAARSAAKTAAARANGKKGGWKKGRPRKPAAVEATDAQ